MSTHKTPFGTVTIAADSVAIEAHSGQLYHWSHRPDFSWPVSWLDDLDSIRVVFDSSGLLECEQDPPYDPETGEGSDIPADEFNAWSSDCLRSILPTDHPCYFVTVGQFEEN